MCMLSHVGLCGAPWSVASQAPLPMGFYRQGHEWGAIFYSKGSS